MRVAPAAIAAFKRFLGALDPEPICERQLASLPHASARKRRKFMDDVSGMHGHDNGAQRHIVERVRHGRHSAELQNHLVLLRGPGQHRYFMLRSHQRANQRNPDCSRASSYKYCHCLRLSRAADQTAIPEPRNSVTARNTAVAWKNGCQLLFTWPT